MRTTRRLPLVVLMTIALTMGVIAPVSAKPKKPKPPPEPEPELICETATLLAGRGGLEMECAWTPEAIDGALTGTVTVEADGEVAYLTIAVRDSAPGDYCYLGNWDRPDATTFAASFDLLGGDGTYWDSDDDWCPGLPGAEDREDLNGKPLTVSVYARVKKGVAVTVTLDPPQGR